MDDMCLSVFFVIDEYENNCMLELLSVKKSVTVQCHEASGSAAWLSELYRLGAVLYGKQCRPNSN